MSVGGKLQARKLEGIWRSRGYGWLMEIKNGKSSFYDVTPSFCMRHTGQESQLEDPGRTIELSEDGQTVRITLDPAKDDTNYAYIFDRVEALPSQANAIPDARPVSVFEALVEIFNQNYAFFALRDIDWPRLVKDYRAEVHDALTDKQLFKILSRLLSHTGDGHVTLCARIGRKKCEFDAVLSKATRKQRPTSRKPDIPAASGYWARGIGEKLVDNGIETGADKSIRFGLIGGDIGLLSIRSMYGGGPKAIASAMDRAIGMFEGCRAVIIDVSMNGGGEDTFGRQIARHFISERTITYYKYPGDTEGAEPQPIYLEPGEGRRYTGPVYVMTSHKTASAAETFTMTLRAQPNVVHIGDTTEGVLSDMLEKKLPNGWDLTLSNEVYIDVEKKHWERRGLPPEISVKVRGGKKSKEKHREAARALLDHILSPLSV